MATTLNFTTAPFTKVTQFTATDTTVTKDILPVNATKDRRIYGITVYTDESAVKDLYLYISDGTTTWRLSTFNIPINSGNTNAIVPVDLFSSTQLSPFIKNRDASGAPYLHIPATWSVRASYGATMTAAKTSNIVIIGELY
ncbi:hypothetical protein UFOVP163_42 [uncultured Caudovirales phage]|uniref:Uncharacterized protein n=1 Tax=uncultured Caudovirales phage TaxID=2100421 RepID=A0A6J7WDJ5_9CAUD|nr:hypothetical protein UFOVP163_42 [uncultured Caudovirales phage]